MAGKYRRFIFVAAGILLALVLEGILSGLAAGRGYGVEEQMFPLQADSVTDYRQEGNHFYQDGEMPSMVFTVGRSLGYVKVDFSEPLSQETRVNLYYTEQKGQQFDQMRRLDYYMMKGTVEGSIPFPDVPCDKIRLDIHGDFVLSGIQGGGRVPWGGLTSGAVLKQADALRLLALAAVLGCSGWMWSGRTRKPGRSRMAYLDGIRVTAAVLVIVVHVVEPVAQLQAPGTVRSLLFNTVVIAGMTCNLLFFLMSGALLLPYKEESVGAFYRKRLLKVVVPFLVYSVFYLRMMCASELSAGEWLAGAARSLISGQVTMGPHLWMIFQLLGIYLLVPFFRYMMKNLPERAEKMLVLLTVVFMALHTYSIYSYQAIGISIFLSSWLGIFLMGYFLNRPWMRRYDWGILAAGAASLVISLWVATFRSDYKDVVCNCSIFMLFMSSSVFVIFVRLRSALDRLGTLLAFLGKYSYSVLLVHWYVLYGIMVHGVVPERWMNKSMGQLLIPLVFTGAVSMGIAVAVDHTAVLVLEKGAQRLFRGRKS